MKKRQLLALYAGAISLITAPAFADDDDDDSSDDDAPKLQVMVDESGEILSAEDDSARSGLAAPSTVGQVDGLSIIVPDASQPRQYNADGSSYAQVGREHFKYLFVTFDENGEMSFEHLTEDQLQNEDFGNSDSLEEE